MKLPELFFHAPINGMPVLEPGSGSETWYAPPGKEQMLEKGGRFASESSPRGLVLSQDCPHLHKLHIYSISLC